MIKKSKKCLALSLSLPALVSSMGSFNIHAMDGGCARPERLARSSVSEMPPTGLTSEDLILKPIQDAKSVYGYLKRIIRYIPSDSEMIVGSFIYEFSKICNENVEIQPLFVCLEGGDVHHAVMLIAEGRCYVIDLAYDLKNEISDCEPFIFTAREYMRFMNSKNSNIRFRALQINFESSLDPRKLMIRGYEDLGDICDRLDSLNSPTKSESVTTNSPYDVPYTEDPEEPEFNEIARSYYRESRIDPKPGYVPRSFAFLTGANIETHTRNIGLPVIPLEDFKKEYMNGEFMNRLKNFEVTCEEILDLCYRFHKSGRRLSGKDSDNVISHYFLVF